MAKLGHQLDLLGQDIVDFDERVSIPRLKKERLERLQAQMAKDDIGGLLLFDPLNIRYATGRRNSGAVKMRLFWIYVLIPPRRRSVLSRKSTTAAPSSKVKGDSPSLKIGEGEAVSGSISVADETWRRRPGFSA